MFCGTPRERYHRLSLQPEFCNGLSQGYFVLPGIDVGRCSDPWGWVARASWVDLCASSF